MSINVAVVRTWHLLVVAAVAVLAVTATGTAAKPRPGWSIAQANARVMMKVRYVDPAAIRIAERIVAHYQAKFDAEPGWDSYLNGANKDLRAVRIGHSAAITDCVIVTCRNRPSVNCRKTGSGRFRCSVKLDGLLAAGYGGIAGPGTDLVGDPLFNEAITTYGYKKFGRETWCGRMNANTTTCTYWGERVVDIRVIGPRSFTYAWRS